MTARAARGAVVATLVATALTACGSHPAPPRVAAPGSTPPRPARARRARGRRASACASCARARCPRPCSCPAWPRVGTDGPRRRRAGQRRQLDRRRRARGARDGRGGSARCPRPPTTSAPPRSAASVYVFGGGTAGGPIDADHAVTPQRARAPAGRLPVAMSDTTAATIGATAYVVGGYTDDHARCARCSPSAPARPAREVARLPHPLRYAAVAAVGGRAARRRRHRRRPRARDEILSVDPPTHRVRVDRRGCRPARARRRRGARRRVLRPGRPRRRDRQPARGDLGHRPAPRGARARAPGACRRRSRTSARSTRRRPHRGRRRPRRARRRVHARAAGRCAALAARRTRGRLRPGAPAALDRRDVYAADAPGRCSRPARSRGDAARVYVPELAVRTRSTSSTSAPRRIVEHFAVGALPQHVTPVVGPAHAVGHQRHAATASRRSTRAPAATAGRSRCSTPTTCTSPPTAAARSSSPRRTASSTSASRTRCACVHALHMPAVRRRRPHGLHRRRPPRARLVRVRRADGRRRPARASASSRRSTLRAGAMPQDVKLSPDGRTFYVADMASNGVWLIDARTHAQGSASSPPAAAPTGCTRAATRGYLYVSNRGEGTITLISFRTRRPVRKWRLPGRRLAGHGRRVGRRARAVAEGRYNGEVYAISTRTGRLLHRIRVGQGRTACASGPSPAATRSGTRGSCGSAALRPRR